MKVFEFEFEADTKVGVSKGGVCHEEKTNRPKWMRSEMRQERLCMYSMSMHRVWSETKQVCMRGQKKSFFQHIGSIFSSLSRSLLKGREEGKDLMVSNKGDLHKPGSGSRAAVVNEKAAASRHQN